MPYLLCSLCLLLCAIASALAGEPQADTKLVFAHYMVCNRDYGPGVEAYKRDIRDAQAYGLDGFALNVGEWSLPQGHYQEDVASLFRAAQELGTGFRFFLSDDGLPSQDVVNFMETYGKHPNYFRYHGRPFLSTYAGQVRPDGASARDWWLNQVLNPLRQAKCNVYFVPFFYLPDFSSPRYDSVLRAYNGWWKDLVDGMFFWASGDLPFSLADSGESYAKVLHANGKTYMASFSPQFWNAKIPSRLYFEYEGGEGTAMQWKSIISVQKPEWIELVTWNDFDEATYLTDMDVTQYWPHTDVTTHGYYKSRVGIRKLVQYYINWYKHYGADQTPPVPDNKDNLYYFYRTHPSAAQATDDPRGPVTEWRGNMEDKIYVTTLLTKEAVFVVHLAGKTITARCPPGMYHFRIPFTPGTPTFEIDRDGVKEFSVTGEPILASPPRYNFNYTSGWAEAP